MVFKGCYLSAKAGICPRLSYVCHMTVLYITVLYLTVLNVTVLYVTVLHASQVDPLLFFTLGMELGKGAFGAVHLATHVLLLSLPRDIFKGTESLLNL